MSAQDLQDIMGLTGEARPPPLKKQRTLEKRTCECTRLLPYDQQRCLPKRTVEKGMAREVSALMGERAPPMSMIPVQPRYKQRPKRAHKAAPWYVARHPPHGLGIKG